jgi:hypothetical protein
MVGVDDDGYGKASQRIKAMSVCKRNDKSAGGCVEVI